MLLPLWIFSGPLYDFKATFKNEFLFPKEKPENDSIDDGFALKEMTKSSSDESLDTKELRVSELDNIAKLKHWHLDVFNHPIISSVIW